MSIKKNYIFIYLFIYLNIIKTLNIKLQKKKIGIIIKENIHLILYSIIIIIIIYYFVLF